MTTDRSNLDETTQAGVLKRSRRRCCICYGLHRDLDIKQGQIAHLDKNCSNNASENLVFLCLDHHDQYDTRTSQSKGFRQKEVKSYRSELDEYFLSWSAQAGSVTNLDLYQRVLLEISLISHQWKNCYMAKYPGQFREGTFERTRAYKDVWEMMLDVATHTYSEDSWQEYLALFTDDIREVAGSLEKIVMMHGDDLPPQMKLTILQANSQLRLESAVYQRLPNLVTIIGEVGFDNLFLERFRSILRVLADVSRLADELKFSPGD